MSKQSNSAPARDDRQEDSPSQCWCGRKKECSRVECSLRKEPSALPPGCASTFPSTGRRTPARNLD